MRGTDPTDPADPARGATPFGAGGEELRIAGDPTMGETVQRVRCAQISQVPLGVERMIAAVTDPRCGAVVTFDGVVRDHDGGRGVDRLEYSAHPLADEAIAEVAREIADRYPDTLVAVAHRHGPLEGRGLGTGVRRRRPAPQAGLRRLRRPGGHRQTAGADLEASDLRRRRERMGGRPLLRLLRHVTCRTPALGTVPACASST